MKEELERVIDELMRWRVGLRMPVKTSDQHIEITPGISGGKPRIAGQSNYSGKHRHLA